MSGGLNQAVEALKSRASETAVSKALQDIIASKQVPATQRKETVAAIGAILSTGIRNASGGLDKVKSASVVVASLKVLAIISRESAQEMPHLGNNFFETIPFRPESTVCVAALSLYITTRECWQGSYEVFSWLQAPEARRMVLKTFEEAAEKPYNDGLMESARALELLGADIAVDSTIKSFPLYRLGKKFLELDVVKKKPENRRLVCNALANFAVPWLVNATVNSEEEMALAKRVLEYVKEDTSKDAQNIKSMAPEFRLLANMCYKSRRAARALRDCDAHSAAIKALGAQDQSVIEAAASLLSNMARKQIKLHQSLLEKQLVPALKSALTRVPNDSDPVVAILSCALNLTSSNAGRKALYGLEPLICRDILPSRPDIAELALGVLWGVCTRENAQQEDSAKDWFEAVFRTLEKHSTHVGCVSRGIGAIGKLLNSNEDAKQLFKASLARLEAIKIKEKHKGNIGVIHAMDTLPVDLRT